jgi:hypothetical protein
MHMSTEMLLIAAAWVLCIVLVSRVTCRGATGSIGLPMACMFAMAFQFCGFIAYAVPGYSHLRSDGSLYLQSYQFTEQTVKLGVEASFLGVVGFVIGSCLLVRDRRRLTAARALPVPLDLPGLERKRLLFLLGLIAVAGFVLYRVELPIPMIQALLLVARNIAVVTVCLGAAFAVRSLRPRSYFVWLLPAAAIPATYLVVWGFVSYGFVVFTCFAGFWLAVLAPRRLSPLAIGAGGALVTYGLLSLFVLWMSFRDQLRAVLWSEGAGIGERMTAVGDALASVELLSPTNFASLDWLNIRLNQYVFVGKAIEWHAIWPDLRLHGETLYIAAFAWIPRFLWPDKPELGGNKLIADHTGMSFHESATFGSGPVFDFFINFGLPGVLVGMIVLGLVVRLVDLEGARALDRGRTLDFVKWFVVGMSFVQPLTEVFFMINTALVSWFAIGALKRVLPNATVMVRTLDVAGSGRAPPLPLLPTTNPRMQRSNGA